MDYVVAVLVGIGLAEVAAFISTLYLHRVLSHKAIELHPAVTFFMRIGTWMLTSISPREWPSIASTTTPQMWRVTSPHIEGYWKIMQPPPPYPRTHCVFEERPHRRLSSPSTW